VSSGSYAPETVKVFLPPESGGMTSLSFAPNPMLYGVRRKDFMSHPGEVYIPVPLDLKIEEYFHTLSSVGAGLSQRRRDLDAPASPGLAAGAAKVVFPRRSVGTSQKYVAPSIGSLLGLADNTLCAILLIVSVED